MGGHPMENVPDPRHEEQQTALEKLRALFVAQPKPSAPRPEVTPNRKDLRSKGIGTSKSFTKGTPFARMTRYKVNGSDLDRYVTFYYKDENGKTTKRVTLPKDKVDMDSVRAQREAQRAAR